MMYMIYICYWEIIEECFHVQSCDISIVKRLNIVLEQNKVMELYNLKESIYNLYICGLKLVKMCIFILQSKIQCMNAYLWGIIYTQLSFQTDIKF